MKKQSLAEGGCMPMDTARPHHSRLHFSVFTNRFYHPGLFFITVVN